MKRPAGTKQTLEYSLRPHAVPEAIVLRRHPAIVPLVARILGVVPRVFSYLEIWPPAFETYSLVVPAFFNLPACDLGFGIGSKRRSLVAYASSYSYGCMYCAAHSAALGNVFQGAFESLEEKATAIEDGACMLPSPEERALVEYGIAVGGTAGAPCEREMNSLAEHFSSEQIEQIVLVAATMGLLNRCLDTFGMVLEGPLLKMARSQLKSGGWLEEGVYDERFDEELLAAESPPPKLGALGLGRCMVGALRFESKHLGAFPSSKQRQEELARSVLGFCPAYLLRFNSGRARKTLLHLLIHRLVSTQGQLSPQLRCAVALVLARGMGASILEAHTAYLCARFSHVEELDRLLSLPFADPDPTTLDHDTICLRAAYESSNKRALSMKTLETLTARLDEGAIVELVLTLSIATCLHRILRSYPQKLEPEVRAFVDQHGAKLGLGS